MQDLSLSMMHIELAKGIGNRALMQCFSCYLNIQHEDDIVIFYIKGIETQITTLIVPNWTKNAMSLLLLTRHAMFAST